MTYSETGKNIHPAEIETVLVTHPAVPEAAVVGRPDETWGEVPVAFIVRKKDGQVTREELIETCQQNLAGYKKIKDVVFVDAIPKNSVGKVLKKELQSELAQ